MNDSLLLLVLKGGKEFHKDGTVGEGSGGARAGAGRKKTHDDYASSANPAVLKIEAEHALDKNESLFVVNGRGEIVTSFKGSSDKVGFDTDEDAQKIAGNIVTHNHPFSLSADDVTFPGLSMQDISTSAELNAKEVRSVDKFGAYAYSYRFNSNAAMDGRRVQTVLDDYVTKNNPIREQAIEKLGDMDTVSKDQKLLEQYSEIESKYHSGAVAYMAKAIGDDYRIYDRKTGKEIKR